MYALRQTQDSSKRRDKDLQGSTSHSPPAPGQSLLTQGAACSQKLEALGGWVALCHGPLPSLSLQFDLIFLSALLRPAQHKRIGAFAKWDQDRVRGPAVGESQGPGRPQEGGRGQ